MLIRFFSRLIFFGVFVVIFFNTLNCVHAAEVAGIDFPENAFADTILSTDFTGTCGAARGAVCEDLEDAILGPNIYTWAEYGQHDRLPGEDGDYNSDAPPTQYIELGFTDNMLYNGESYDVALFEYGDANSIRVALDLESIQHPYSSQSVTVVVSPVYAGIINIQVGYLDLSDLGVPEGRAVDHLFVSSALGENGEVYWHSPGQPADQPDWGVPETAAVGALFDEIGPLYPDSEIVVPQNQAPRVSAGHDFEAEVLEDVRLSGNVEDDGLPDGCISMEWSLIDGPGNVIFRQSESATTLVVFDAVGTYVLQLEADDGDAADTDTVEIIVVDSTAPTRPDNLHTIMISESEISLEWDDAEDNIGVSGYIVYRDNEPLATVPESAFTDADISPSTTYSYTIEAFDASENHSERSVSAEVITGAPNQAPNVDAGDNFTVVVSESVALNGTVEDDRLPEESLSISWSCVSGAADAVRFGSPAEADGTVTFDKAGTYVLQIEVSDNEFTVADQVEVMVLEPAEEDIPNDNEEVTIPEPNEMNIPDSDDEVTGVGPEAEDSRNGDNSGSGCFITTLGK